MIASSAARAAAETDEGGPTTDRRNALPILLALILIVASGVVPALAGTKEDLDAAKAELARVQSELDRATARLNEAQSRLYATRTEIADTRIRIRRLEQQRCLEQVVSPVHHFRPRQMQALDARRKGARKQERWSRRRRCDGELRREEARRQPSSDDRTRFNRFAGDQRLEEGAHACA